MQKTFLLQMQGFDPLKIKALNIQDVILYLMDYFGRKNTIDYKAIKCFTDYNDMIEMFEQSCEEIILYILDLNNNNFIYMNENECNWCIDLNKDNINIEMEDD